jgi:hypothetical protein
MKAIDPSEILLDKEGTIREDYIASPWTRFLARFFDYGWFFLLLALVRFFLHTKAPSGKFESLIPLEFFAWVPFEALLLTYWGSTPGKYFLKIKMRQGRRFKLPFMVALKRSFNVWLKGLGMMIPIVNGVCLLLSYHRLKVFQTTSWDREDHIIVTAAPVGQWRTVAASLFTALSLLFYYNSHR